MNPYPVKKNFYLKTNRPDLLKFKEEGLMVSKTKGFAFMSHVTYRSNKSWMFLKNWKKSPKDSFSVAGLNQFSWNIQIHNAKDSLSVAPHYLKVNSVDVALRDCYIEMNLASFLAHFLDFQSKCKDVFTYQLFVGAAPFTYSVGSRRQ